MSRTSNARRCSRHLIDINSAEDPLVGVARLINATAELKTKHPNLGGSLAMGIFLFTGMAAQCGAECDPHWQSRFCRAGTYGVDLP